MKIYEAVHLLIIDKDMRDEREAAPKKLVQSQQESNNFIGRIIVHIAGMEYSQHGVLFIPRKCFRCLSLPVYAAVEKWCICRRDPR